MRRWAWYMGLIAALLVTAFDATANGGIRGRRRSGCSDPSVTYYKPVTYTQSAGAPAVPHTVQRPISQDCLTGSWTELRVVLEPTYATEKRTVCLTSYKDEERTRVVRRLGGSGVESLLRGFADSAVLWRRRIAAVHLVVPGGSIGC